MYVLTWANIHFISFKVYKLKFYFETVIKISSFFQVLLIQIAHRSHNYTTFLSLLADFS